MQWVDEGIIVATASHGESRTILTVLTKNHGLTKGIVRKSKSTKINNLQIGTHLKLQWQARLAEHMGLFSMVDPLDSIAADIIDDYLSLLILQSAAAVVASTLPERHPYPHLFEKTKGLLKEILAGEAVAAYVFWELNLLSELGFGLNLSKCGATGQLDDLAYISPKTGRAISRNAGQPYHDKLLYLPDFLKIEVTNPISWFDLFSGLQATGLFLGNYLYHGHVDKIPGARARLLSYVFRKIDERLASEA